MGIGSGKLSTYDVIGMERTMSDDRSKETIRRSYEAMIAGDVPTLMAQLADDCVWHEAGGQAIPHAGEHKGPGDIMAMLGNLAVLTDGTGKFTLEDLFSDGEGHVVAVHRVTGSRSDGRSIDTREAMVFLVEDGLIKSVRNCYDDVSKGIAFWSER
jgi:ketosteroid isomerase-like protein